MSIYRDSVGWAPFWTFQVTFAICVVFLGILAIQTHRFGPSVGVSGLKQPVDLVLHKNSPEYATAIATRFVHEHLNWSWQGHMNAKRRAAYLCSPPMQALVIRQARSVDGYYRQLLMAQNAKQASATVVWSDPDLEEYVVEIITDVEEWQGHVHSLFPMKATVFLAPRPYDTESPSPFALHVTVCELKPLADAKVVQQSVDTQSLSMSDEVEALLQQRAEASAAGSARQFNPMQQPAAEPSAPLTTQPAPAAGAPSLKE